MSKNATGLHYYEFTKISIETHWVKIPTTKNNFTQTFNPVIKNEIKLK